MSDKLKVVELDLDYDTIWKHSEESERKRAEMMPDEITALKVMNEAYKRLKELGFKEAQYCPKDGSLFNSVEAGSIGISVCSYSGEWPTGHYWIHAADDLWPSRPILFRPITNNP